MTHYPPPLPAGGGGRRAGRKGDAMAGEGTPRKLGAGALQAALRQGAKEIGTALKPLPDSIAVEEPGTILSPTQGEIAEANRGSIWGRVRECQERAAATRDEPAKGPDRE